MARPGNLCLKLSMLSKKKKQLGLFLSHITEAIGTIAACSYVHVIPLAAEDMNTSVLASILLPWLKFDRIERQT